MNILTYVFVAVFVAMTIACYIVFLIYALADDRSGKYIIKAVKIPTLVSLVSLGVSLTALYLTRPSLSNIIGWSPPVISILVFYLGGYLWLSLSILSIQKLTFPIFQSKYGLTKSDFRDFASMNIFNKEKKLEKWRDNKSPSSFDFKK